MPKKSTTEDFVRRAQALHGHRYDYSKTRYIAALVKVTIICPKHGEFQQTPAHHLFGKGQRCPACGGAKKKNTEQFIVDACKIHGDKYDYSKVRYKNAKTKVTIICREHGPFEQKPNGHLMGDGCPACGIVRTQEHHAALRTGMSAEERTRSKGRRTAEEFIADAHRLYGDKYDYGQVKYVNSYTKATIICRKLLTSA